MRLLLCLLALILPLGVIAKESEKDILAALPDKIANLPRGELHSYEQSGLGASVSCKAEGITITAYVYDLGREKVADGLEDPAIKEAFEAAKREIARSMKAEYYTTVNTLSEGTGDFGKGRATLRAQYRLTHSDKSDHPGVEFFSETQIVGARDYIIKLRISHAAGGEAELKKVSVDFIPVFMDAIRGKTKLLKD